MPELPEHIDQIEDFYKSTFDNESEVVLRLASKPKSVTVSGQALKQLNQLEGDGYEWKALEKGGVLKLKYSIGQDVNIYY